MSGKKRISDSVSGPSKKRYKVSFKPEYSLEFPCIVRGKDPSFARCKVCDCEFRIDHAGRDDCRKHVNSKKHLSNHQVVSAVKPITSFMRTDHSTLDNAVIRAETLFTNFLLEHNLQLSASDHASKLFKEMFVVDGLNSKDIIQKYSCGRTKASAIAHELALDDRAQLIKTCQSQAFSISTDGSNDNDNKLYPLVISYASDENKVKTELLSLLELKNRGTGHNISELINEEMSSLDIPWRNCLSLCTDNAHAMIGMKSGLFGCLLHHQPNLFSTGCACHRLHLAAEWAAKALPFNPDSFFIDIYYYLDKSANRLQNLKTCQVECGTDPLKVPKHVPTRWLSLGKVTKWALQQWEPLTKFFKNECHEDKETKKSLKCDDLKADRKKKVLDNLESRVVKLTLLYLNFILPRFEVINLKLQGEEPLVHKQRRLILELIRELMVMFVKPCAMIYKQVTDVDITSSYNFKPVDQIQIGSDAKDYMNTSKLPQEKVTNFYKCVQKFLLTAVNYLLKNLKLDDPLYINAEVADISLQQSTSFRKLEYFLDRFPVLIPRDFNKDDVQTEFLNYQSQELPCSVTSAPQADQQWKAMMQITSVTGEKRFKVLPHVMLSILAIPHSNASSERIFSMVRKNRTDFRSNMSVGTLQSILIKKQKGGACYQQKFSSDLLKRCKSATSRLVWGPVG